MRCSTDFNDAEYRACLKREYDRERKAMKTAQGGFEDAMLSLDTPMGGEEGEAENTLKDWISDNGVGAELIRNFDEPDDLEEFRKRLHAARQHLIRKDRRLLPVFNLIVKNGSNREKSICELAKKKRKRGTRQISSTGHT